MGPWLRSLAVWVVIILAESIHGTLRQVLLVPVMGDLPARRVSVFSGALITFGVTWLFIRWMRVGSRRRLLQVGALWVGLTVAFEILLGRALGYSWARLLEDYDLTRGGLMGLGLIAMLFTPWVAARVRGVPTD
jgi:hypothetical protein